MFFFFFPGRKRQNHSKPALWAGLIIVRPSNIIYIIDADLQKLPAGTMATSRVKPGAGFEGFLAVHGVWGSSSARPGLVDIGGHGDKETPVVLKK